VQEGKRWRWGQRSHAASRTVLAHLAATRCRRPCGRGPPRLRACLLSCRRKLGWRVVVDRRTPASDLRHVRGVRHRPCWRASLQVRGPPALQVSFAVGGGSAAGPVGELRHERGVCRRPCRQAPPRARGPLSALQASSGVGAMSAAVTLSPASSPPSLHYGKRPKFAFPTMHLVQCLLHCLSLAILICGLLNTRELHYTSLDSQYAAYQTPVHD
jgi:hypothetical protein